MSSVLHLEDNGRSREEILMGKHIPLSTEEERKVEVRPPQRRMRVLNRLCVQRLGPLEWLAVPIFYAKTSLGHFPVCYTQNFLCENVRH